MMSGGTNFHIWHNSELAGLRQEFLAESSNSSIWTLHSTMNQQAEAPQSFCYVSKPVTQSCPCLSQFHLGVDTIVQITVFDSYRRGWRISTCRFIAYCNVLIKELELSASLALILVNSLLCYIWKLVPPDITHVISFTRLPLFSSAMLKRLGSLGTRLGKSA